MNNTLKHGLAIAVGGICVLPVYGWICVRSGYIGNIFDSAVYLLLADVFSPYRPLSHELFEFLLSEYAFPPLYPMMLGLLGGGSEAPQMSYLIGALFQYGALVYLFYWLRRESVSLLSSGLLVAIVGLLPTTLLHLMGVFSEQLYMLLTFIAIVLLANDKLADRRFLIAALIVGLSAVARSAGVAAIAALILFWLQRTGGRRLFAVPLLAIFPLAAWQSIKLVAGFEASYLNSFSRGGIQQSLELGLEQIVINLSALPVHTFLSFDFIALPSTQVVITGLSVVAAIGLVRRLTRGCYDAYYFTAYLFIIFVWPYPNHFARFLLVVLPLWLAYSLFGLSQIFAWARLARAPAYAAAAVLGSLALVCGPTTAYILETTAVTHNTELAEFAKTPQWYRTGRPQDAYRDMEIVQRMLESMKTLGEFVPASSCITTTTPPMVLLNAKRVARLPPPPGEGVEKLYEAIEKCPYVFMMAITSWPADGYSPMYPFHLIDDAVEVLDVAYLHPDGDDAHVISLLGKVDIKSLRGEQNMTP
ncbi:MAG: hypothetical protein AAF384_13425 [Pseudomonadota bacterium]